MALSLLRFRKSISATALLGLQLFKLFLLIFKQCLFSFCCDFIGFLGIPQQLKVLVGSNIYRHYSNKSYSCFLFLSYLSAPKMGCKWLAFNWLINTSDISIMNSERKWLLWIWMQEPPRDTKNPLLVTGKWVCTTHASPLVQTWCWIMAFFKEEHFQCHPWCVVL